MAKRFTDSDKWKKPWFRGLTTVQKCFWIYITDSCDQAGIWDVDFALAEIFIGEKLNEQELRTIFKKQYLEIHDGKKWFLQDFIEFQYGELSYASRFHAFILKLLKKQGVLIPLTWGIQGAKDKDIYKDKDKDIKEGVKGERQEGFKEPTLQEATDAFIAGGLDKSSAKGQAQLFLAYYESVGWIVGKSRKPMKSWAGAVTTWLHNCNGSDAPKAKKVSKWKCFVSDCGQEMPEDERAIHMENHQRERALR